MTNFSSFKGCSYRGAHFEEPLGIGGAVPIAFFLFLYKNCKNSKVFHADAAAQGISLLYFIILNFLHNTNHLEAGKMN